MRLFISRLNLCDLGLVRFFNLSSILFWSRIKFTLLSFNTFLFKTANKKAFKRKKEKFMYRWSNCDQKLQLAGTRTGL